MTTPDVIDREQLEAELATLDGRSARAREIKDILSPSSGGGGVEALTPIGKGESGTRPPSATARYWFGFRPVGRRQEDPSDIESPFVDAPELSPYPPFFNRTVGGQTFLQYQERVVRKDPETNEAVKERRMGVLKDLTTEEVEELKDGLRRMWVRWHDRDGKRRHAQPVVIPKDKYVEEAKAYAAARKRPEFEMNVPYIENGDKSIMDYVYVVKADARGAQIPPPVRQTGIEMP